MGLAVETLLAVAVADGKITLAGDAVAERINATARGLISERAAIASAEAPYAFWLGAANPLDGTRLWDNS